MEFAGTLNERVQIEQWAGEPDGGSWTPGGDAWGALVSQGHGPEVEGQGRKARPRWRLTLRARDDVGLATRFAWRGRVLNVLRVEATMARDRIVVLVEDRG